MDDKCRSGRQRIPALQDQVHLGSPGPRAVTAEEPPAIPSPIRRVFGSKIMRTMAR